jgi:WD40 repeat protein
MTQTITPAITQTVTTTISQTVTPVPCSATFTPVGFWHDNDHLLGRLAIEGQATSRLQLLDLKTLHVATVLEYPRPPGDWAVLSPDQQLIAIPRPDFSIALIRLVDKQVKATLSGHTAFVTGLAFSVKGDRIFTSSMDKTVRTWDLSGKSLHVFQPNGADNLPSEVVGLGLSPDGARLVTIPAEGLIKAWDTTEYKKQGSYEGPISGGYNGASATFSPDGRYLAVGLAAGTGAVSLWRVADGELLWRGGLFGFAFSPDSQYFASTQMKEGNDFQEQVFIRSGDGQQIIRVLDQTFETAIGVILFSPDSSQLLTGGDVTQVWRIADGQLLQTYRFSCP